MLAIAQHEEENQILATLPYNGCGCNRQMDLAPGQQKKGCINTARWLNIAYSEDNYLYISSYKLYQGFLQQAQGDNTLQSQQIERDIQIDLDRTFQ